MKCLRLPPVLGIWFAVVLCAATGAPENEVAAPLGEAPISVYVIPVEGPIDRAAMFVFRRGMKEAIALEADLVVLDMDTPGGRLDITLEIMEMLDRFSGETLTFVDTDAISAGAFIAAATNEIHFAPRGVMGAAAPVSGTGEEIPETMKLKVLSYLGARIRAFTEEIPYRAEVVNAMVDAEAVLEIDGTVISGKGELLSLTAAEAMREYGDPPRPLLGAGIAEDLETLLDRKYGGGGYAVTEFVPTWSEELARWLTAMSPLLLGIGLLCLFLEVKTPGFGVTGIAGIVLLSLVFLGHHLAGLAGMEPVLFFLLGFSLVLAEVFFFPGLILPGLVGVVLIVASLLWGMADIWPGERFEWSWGLFVRPVTNLFAGLVLAVAGAAALWKFLPKSWFWDKLVLGGGSTGNSQGAKIAPSGGPGELGRPAIGARGTAVTDLFPSGEVEIDGRRFQARIDHGSASRGDRVEVAGYLDFGLLVRKKSR